MGAAAYAPEKHHVGTQVCTWASSTPDGSPVVVGPKVSRSCLVLVPPRPVRNRRASSGPGSLRAAHISDRGRQLRTYGNRSHLQLRAWNQVSSRRYGSSSPFTERNPHATADCPTVSEPAFCRRWDRVGSPDGHPGDCRARCRCIRIVPGTPGPRRLGNREAGHGPHEAQ